MDQDFYSKNCLVWRKDFLRQIYYNGSQTMVHTYEVLCAKIQVQDYGSQFMIQACEFGRK